MSDYKIVQRAPEFKVWDTVWGCITDDDESDDTVEGGVEYRIVGWEPVLNGVEPRYMIQAENPGEELPFWAYGSELTDERPLTREDKIQIIKDLMVDGHFHDALNVALDLLDIDRPESKK